MELERPSDLFVGHESLEVPVTPLHRHPEILSRFLYRKQGRSPLRMYDALVVYRFHRSRDSLLSFGPCAADIRQRFPRVLPGCDEFLNDLLDIPGNRFYKVGEILLEPPNSVLVPLDGSIPINARATIFRRGHALLRRTTPDHFHLFGRDLEIHDVFSYFAHVVLPSRNI